MLTVFFSLYLFAVILLLFTLPPIHYRVGRTRYEATGILRFLTVVTTVPVLAFLCLAAIVAGFLALPFLVVAFVVVITTPRSAR